MKLEALIARRLKGLPEVSVLVHQSTVAHQAHKAGIASVTHKHTQ